MFMELTERANLKARELPDAIIAAVALDAGCGDFFTFDKKLNRLAIALRQSPSDPSRQKT